MIKQLMVEVEQMIDKETYTLRPGTHAEKCGGVSVPMAQRDYKDPILAFYRKDKAMDEQYIVRRLTPKECARLQGMPDNWCDLVPHKDSHEYKAYGNGMALPCVLYVMEGIKNLIENEEEDGRC